MILISSQAGQAKFKMVVEVGDCNGYMTMHGGLGASLVDLCSSVAVLAKYISSSYFKSFHVIISLFANFECCKHFHKETLQVFQMGCFYRLDNFIS